MCRLFTFRGILGLTSEYIPFSPYVESDLSSCPSGRGNNLPFSSFWKTPECCLLQSGLKPLSWSYFCLLLAFLLFANLHKPELRLLPSECRAFGNWRMRKAWRPSQLPILQRPELRRLSPKCKAFESWWLRNAWRASLLFSTLQRPELRGFPPRVQGFSPLAPSVPYFWNLRAEKNPEAYWTC